MKKTLDAPANAFKSRLAAQETLIGCWASLASPYAIEISADAGFDWVLIDGEHAPNDVRTTVMQLQAAAAHPSPLVIRPPHLEPWLIKQYLDIGAQTLLAPLVDTADQARALVAATRYPPEGIRGVGAAFARASAFGKRARYIATANDEICILAQAETALAIRNLADIARVPGIDGVFIGPSDLAASMGHPGNPAHPEVQETILAAIATILACGKAPGILCMDPALAARYIEAGVRFIAVGSDVLTLTKGLAQLASQFKAGPSKQA
ncbi:hypothetical protein GG851_00115 [Bordetella petrii]|nr:hypothetical protein [Bordetella petrii]